MKAPLFLFEHIEVPFVQFVPQRIGYGFVPVSMKYKHIEKESKGPCV